MGETHRSLLATESIATGRLLHNGLRLAFGTCHILQDLPQRCRYNTRVFKSPLCHLVATTHRTTWPAISPPLPFSIFFFLLFHNALLLCLIYFFSGLFLSCLCCPPCPNHTQYMPRVLSLVFQLK